jgi:hypothetical protein
MVVSRQAQCERWAAQSEREGTSPTVRFGTPYRTLLLHGSQQQTSERHHTVRPHYGHTSDTPGEERSSHRSPCCVALGARTGLTRTKTSRQQMPPSQGRSSSTEEDENMQRPGVAIPASWRNSDQRGVNGRTRRAAHTHGRIWPAKLGPQPPGQKLVRSNSNRDRSLRQKDQATHGDGRKHVCLVRLRKKRE